MGASTPGSKALEHGTSRSKVAHSTSCGACRAQGRRSRVVGAAACPRPRPSRAHPVAIEVHGSGAPAEHEQARTRRADTMLPEVYQRPCVGVLFAIVNQSGPDRIRKNIANHLSQILIVSHEVVPEASLPVGAVACPRPCPSLSMSPRRPQHQAFEAPDERSHRARV